MGAITHVETALAIQQVTSTKKRSSTYVKYLPPQRFKIGKYASENGFTNAVRKFQNEFPILKESTAREFQKIYEKIFKENKDRLRRRFTNGTNCIKNSD